MAVDSPCPGDTRIVRVDEHNVAVQVYTEMDVVRVEGKKRVKTGEKRCEWRDRGYYGHRLDYAAESALFLAMPYGEQITPAVIKDAVRSISANFLKKLGVKG